MAGTFVDDGNGTLVVFGTSGFDAQITDADWSDITREELDTSNLATPQPAAGDFGNMTSIPSRLIKPGTLTLEIHFNADLLPPLFGPQITETGCRQCRSNARYEPCRPPRSEGLGANF